MKAFATVRTVENVIRATQEKITLARPATEADIAYRQKVEAELAQAVNGATPEGLPLRFHGAPIYHATEIIRSSEITPNVDRLGSGTGYDGSGSISVTTTDSLHWTVSDYIGAREYMLPAGCIFVMLPNSEDDAAAGAHNAMNSVDFTERPEQLFRILTSEENVDMIKARCVDARIDPAKVREYFEFPEELSRIGQQIKNGDLALQNLIPYNIPEQVK